MNTFIVHPQTEAQHKAVKAILEALEIDFEMVDAAEDPYILPPHVLEGIKISEEQFKTGQFYTHGDVKKMIADR
jgi:hypothetical protein